MNEEILKVVNIEKYYGKKGNVVKAINNISFCMDKGEFVAIMGPSGSGKTTLLNCIATIDRVTSGNIFIKNKDITKIKEEYLSKFRREDLGFVFQDFNLLDTLNNYENISLALSILQVNYKEIDGKVNQISSLLGINGILNKFPYEISGGQKQRVAAARAIITNPNLILADEPTGALDSKSSKSLLDTMKTLQQELNSTILMVTHDAFTASYADRILFIKDGNLFNEIIKGDDDRRKFFNRIIDVISTIGGDIVNVF